MRVGGAPFSSHEAGQEPTSSPTMQPVAKNCTRSRYCMVGTRGLHTHLAHAHLCGTCGGADRVVAIVAERPRSDCQGVSWSERSSAGVSHYACVSTSGLPVTLASNVTTAVSSPKPSSASRSRWRTVRPSVQGTAPAAAESLPIGLEACALVRNRRPPSQIESVLAALGPQCHVGSFQDGQYRRAANPQCAGYLTAGHAAGVMMHDLGA
jgi:hypothetical protein